MDDMIGTRPGLGRVADPPSKRDWPLRALPGPHRAVVPPAALDLRPRLGAVLNQRSTPHCVAYASAAVKTYQERRDHRRTYRFDPDALYARCKARDGIPHLPGTYARVALDVLREEGVAREGRDWATDAGRHRVAVFARVLTLAELEAALATSGPCLLGLGWDESWFRPTGALLTTPAVPRDAGGHEVVAAGYDRRADGPVFSAPGRPAVREKVGLIRNSWGASWSDGGNAAITYAELERQLALPPWESADIWSLVDVEH